MESFTETPVKLPGFEIKAPIGIGCWSWGDSSTWGYGNGYDDSTIEEAFRAAVDTGVNFFDTAELYAQGESERLLGKYIANYKSSISNPEEANISIATKFIPLPWKLTHGSLHSALHASLQRLNQSSVDLYQIHGPKVSLRSVETWAEAMVEPFKKGLIRAVGVSNYNSDQVRRTHQVLSKHGIPLATNQIEYSLLRNNPEHNGLFETCKELGVKIIAYSPLAMGRLTGKYNRENPPPSGRKFGNVTMDQLESVVKKLQEVGERHNKTPSQVALNWCICKGTIPIVGVKNIKQAKENLAAIGWRLSPEEVEELDKVSISLPTTWWQES